MSTRFFRLFLPGISRKLLLPRAFVKNIIKEKCITRATLVNPNGKSWQVNIHKEKQSMYFVGASWLQLIHAHNLGLGYLLTFSYKGNMVFNFKAYDLSSCEIIYPSVGNKIQMKKRSHNKVIKEEDHNSTSGIKQFEVTMTTHTLSFQYLYIPVKFTRECREFARQRELVLKDPKGRSWDVHLHHRKIRAKSHGSGMHIRDGWLQFAKGNKLKRGDRCIFKLGNIGGDQQMVLQVDILREADH